MTIKNRLNQFWNTIEALDERIYIALLLAGAITAFGGFLVALIERLSYRTLFTAAACLVWYMLFLVAALRQRKPIYWQRLLFVCVLNFIFCPLIFFAYGGISGGMTLFYLLALLNVAVLLRGRTRVIVFFISFFELLLSLYLSRSYPALIVPLTEVQYYRNTKLSLFIAGLTSATLVGLILREYEAERARNLELMERLRGMSTRDALSGLYNRRELSRRLDLVYKAPQERAHRDDRLTREQCYIAMFDVDDFKRLNDTYGHQFGDLVLSTVAQKLNDAMAPRTAEFAARYGGEEFVCLLHADSPEDAFRRTDAMRQSIASLSWSDVPGLSVTVSGGLVSCESYDLLKPAMSDVDKLLYQAKHGGKNQIATQLRSTEEHPV